MHSSLKKIRSLVEFFPDSLYSLTPPPPYSIPRAYAEKYRIILLYKAKTTHS